MSDGFVDLRLNRENSDHNESFWPSFTDIMTVIVMIFLLAMIVLITRNTDLVKQLTETLAAERLATAEATESEKIKAVLAKKLEENVTKVVSLQQILEALKEKNLQQERDITQLDLEKSNLQTTQEKLQQELEQSTSAQRLSSEKNREIEDQLRQRQQQLDAVQQNLAQLQQQSKQQQHILHQLYSLEP